MSGKRAHVIMPERLVDEIDALVGKRGRSAFIVEAARQELERRRLALALAEAEGGWKDENHPELGDGAAAHVARQRREDETRDEDRRGRLPA